MFFCPKQLVWCHQTAAILFLSAVSVMLGNEGIISFEEITGDNFECRVCYASVSVNLAEVELASYTWLLLSALWEIYLDTFKSFKKWDKMLPW